MVKYHLTSCQRGLFQRSEPQGTIFSQHVKGKLVKMPIALAQWKSLIVKMRCVATLTRHFLLSAEIYGFYVGTYEGCVYSYEIKKKNVSKEWNSGDDSGI